MLFLHWIKTFTVPHAWVTGHIVLYVMHDIWSFSWKRNPDLREDQAQGVQAVKISCCPAPKHHLLHANDTHTHYVCTRVLSSYETSDRDTSVGYFSFTCHVFTFWHVINLVSAKAPQLYAHLELALNKWKWTCFPHMSLALCFLHCDRVTTALEVDRKKRRWLRLQGPAPLTFSSLVLHTSPCQWPTFEHCIGHWPHFSSGFFFFFGWVSFLGTSLEGLGSWSCPCSRLLYADQV